jgi:hypothetical protein
MDGGATAVSPKVPQRFRDRRGFVNLGGLCPTNGRAIGERANGRFSTGKHEYQSFGWTYSHYRREWVMKKERGTKKWFRFRGVS